MIVIDTSAVVDALVDDPVNPELLALMGSQELHAPALLDFEVASALRSHVLGKKLAADRLPETLEDFVALDIHRYQMTGLLRNVLELRDNFTAYDAAYVVLAQALEAPLVTADAKLEFARGLGVDVQVVRSAR